MASLSDGLMEHAAARPDAIAVRGPDSIYTYGQLKDGILAYAGMLRERGIERGDVDPRADLELMMDMLSAPLFYRQYHSGASLGPAVTDAIVDAVLVGEAV